MTQIEQVQIRVHGKAHTVPSVTIDGTTIIAKGTWLRLGSIRDENLVNGVRNASALVAGLKKTRMPLDVLTFTEKLPNVTPHRAYYFEWDNIAAIPITTYSHWLQKLVEPDVRSAVKKATRLGVTVKIADYDDAFVQGIVEIYNETPVRQGTKFWHYQKDFATVKTENATFLDRSTFIGAYFDDQLIGFIKLVFLGSDEAVALQVISRTDHFNKKPTNALIAKAVEMCEQKGIGYLTYGNYVYNDPNSSLTEFKRRNGFQRIDFPRYYVPLTLKGKFALKLNLHHGVKGIVPQRVLTALLRFRATTMNAAKARLTGRRSMS
jgi:hypothetical protein